jgi:hypothetical protein
MPTETDVKVDPKDLESIQVDLLKVSKDICEHLSELILDTGAYVIPPQGQSALMDLATMALERMVRYVREVEGMPEDNFMMVDGPQRAAVAEAKAKAKAERAKRAAVERKLKAEAEAKHKAELAKLQAAKGHEQHATGHEGRQGLSGAEAGRR